MNPIEKARASVNTKTCLKVAFSAKQIAENMSEKKGDKFRTAVQYVKGKYFIAANERYTKTRA